MQTTILVTGATGFVGAHAALELLRAGYRVKGTFRSSASIEKARQIFGYHTSDTTLFERLQWVEVDLFNIKEVAETMRDVDYVLHTAAEVSFNNRYKNRLIENNTRIAANVVDAALEVGIKKLCHISSIAALGTTANRDPISEDTKLSSVKGQSGYAISKFYSEMEVWRGINLGLNAVILNPSVILGAGDWKTSSSTFISTIAKGAPFYTKGVTGFIDVMDVAKACRIVLENDVSGERFLLSAENLSYQYLFNTIAVNLHRRTPSILVAPLVLKVLAVLAMGLSYITKKEPIITLNSARTAWKKSYYSGSKFADRFGFTYSSILLAIRFACKSYLRDKSNAK